MTFWDIVAPLYDTFEVFNKAYRQMINKVRDLIPQEANVIELACGTGNVSLAISDKANKVLCTDISDSMLKTASKKARKRNISNIEFEKASIFETGKHDNSFDVVIASQILHLLDEPKQACNEIKRITRDIAIVPIPLVREGTNWGKFLIKLYKVFGFKPKYDFDNDSCKIFLEEIGFNDCEYHTIYGAVSLGVAVWKKATKI